MAQVLSDLIPDFVTELFTEELDGLPTSQDHENFCALIESFYPHMDGLIRSRILEECPELKNIPGEADKAVVAFSGLLVVMWIYDLRVWGKKMGFKPEDLDQDMCVPGHEYINGGMGGSQFFSGPIPFSNEEARQILRAVRLGLPPGLFIPPAAMALVR